MTSNETISKLIERVQGKHTNSNYSRNMKYNQIAHGNMTCNMVQDNMRLNNTTATSKLIQTKENELVSHNKQHTLDSKIT